MNKLILCTFLVSLSCYSKNHNLRDKNGNGSIAISSEWSLLKEVFGMPFLFVSKGEPPKSSLSVTFTGLKEIKLNAKGLKNAQVDYVQGRKAWAKKYIVKIKKFFPYSSYTNSKGRKVHKIGFQYSRRKKEYIEHSYYVECKTSLAHMKSLIIDNRKDYLEQISNAVNSFDCK